LTFDEVKEIHPFGPYYWGMSSLGIANRLRGLGWKPSRPDIQMFIAEAVDVEAKSLGI
jgi:hypothetical protein